MAALMCAVIPALSADNNSNVTQTDPLPSWNDGPKSTNFALEESTDELYYNGWEWLHSQPSLARFAIGMAIIVGIPPLSRRVGIPAVVGLLL